MSILILGKGFVGTHLHAHFQKNKIKSTIYSQSELEYTDPNTLAAYLDECSSTSKIDVVVNCSGYTGVPNVDACEYNKELCYNYNVVYPLDVLTVCERRSIPVIHIGSGCIYSGYNKAYEETDTPNFGVFSDESSYYSKCKHIFETFAKQHQCYVLRIRIPFTDDTSRKNYFTKLLNYNTLISENNSITSINDFNVFVTSFIDNMADIPYGLYNVVNPEPVTARAVVTLMQKYNLNNPNWSFIDLKDLNTRANRSNCVLSTKKIAQLGLSLPPTVQSLERDIKALAEKV
jgi:3,5-epimerase/4-reductase